MGTGTGGAVRTGLSCESIARTALGAPVRKMGRELLWRCPNHEDQHPSLSINPTKDCFMCGPCATSGNAWQLAAFLGKVSPDDKTAVKAWLKDHALLNGKREIVALYEYHNADGKPVGRVVRTSPKGFYQEKPNSAGGWEPAGFPPTLYRLPDLTAAQDVLIPEGEKDVDCARSLGFSATCNSGGAGKWRSEYAAHLAGKRVVVIADADAPGIAHANDICRSLIGRVEKLKLVSLAPAKDLSEWVERGSTRGQLDGLIAAAPVLTAADVAGWARAKTDDPWAAAETMAEFLADDDDAPAALYESFLYPATVTEIFSPRGIGKSLFAAHVFATLARQGKRVLLIDRDNPRHVVKARLRAWGVAETTDKSFRIITREKCPPLTNGPAWALFPYSDYDVVILDSFDSLAEGVGEQDSGKPSKAIAPLLDIARRENGPAVLILGNCVRSAAHSRGSGVIEDRADIVFEVRDATDFHPTGKRPWVEELPPADAASWAGRSSRRKQKEKYRLAFIASKFRIAEEPEPFIFEIDTASERWTLKDVTDEVDQEGKAERDRRAKERADAVASAIRALENETIRRREAREPELLKKQAEAFLTSRGVKQRIAREAINSLAFEAVQVAGKGHPKALRVADKNGNLNRNTAVTEPVTMAGERGTDFGCPVSMHPTEIDQDNGQYLCGSEKRAISVKDSIYTPSDGPNGPVKNESVTGEKEWDI